MSRNQTKLHYLVELGKANLVAILCCSDLLAGADNRSPNGQKLVIGLLPDFGVYLVIAHSESSNTALLAGINNRPSLKLPEGRGDNHSR